MHTDQFDEPPKPQRYKVMTVTNISPGLAADPKHGHPVALVSLTHKGVTEPLMFKLKDVRRLALGLMAVLSHHTGDCPEEIVRAYFYDDGEDDPSTTSPEAVEATLVPSPPSQRAKTPRPPLTAQVRFCDRSIKPITISVLGGYRCNRSTMILVRPEGLSDQAVTSLASLGRGGRIRFKVRQKSDCLKPEHWGKLIPTSKARQFKIGGRVWQRLTDEQIRAAVHGKTLLSVG